MRYFEPNFLDEALVLLDRFGDGARVLAGATRLGPQLRERTAGVDTLVNIKRIRELHEIRLDRGMLNVGALVTAQQLSDDELVRTHAPLIGAAAMTMGARQLRSVATIGGNVCSGDAAADLSVALLASDALCAISSIRRGPVETPVERILQAGPSGLPSGDLLVALRIPLRPAAIAYQKMTTRRGFEMALVSVAVSLIFEAVEVRHAHIALGGAAPTPVRATGAESALVGRTFSRESAAAAALIAANADATPSDDHRASALYRRHLVEVLALRALLDAGRAHGDAAA